MQQDQTLNVREAAFLLLLPMCSLFEMTSSKYVEGHISTAEVSFKPCSVHFFMTKSDILSQVHVVWFFSQTF
jgi:hypothetical protein